MISLLRVHNYQQTFSVLPVEESVARGPKPFIGLLDAALLLVTILLGAFGVIGYMTYGDSVHDIIVADLPGTRMVSMLKVFMLLGIVFTYPLQILPVARILERAFDVSGSTSSTTISNYINVLLCFNPINFKAIPNLYFKIHQHQLKVTCMNFQSKNAMMTTTFKILSIVMLVVVAIEITKNRFAKSIQMREKIV